MIAGEFLSLLFIDPSTGRKEGTTEKKRKISREIRILAPPLVSLFQRGKNDAKPGFFSNYSLLSTSRTEGQMNFVTIPFFFLLLCLLLLQKAGSKTDAIILGS